MDALGTTRDAISNRAAEHVELKLDATQIPRLARSFTLHLISCGLSPRHSQKLRPCNTAAMLASFSGRCCNQAGYRLPRHGCTRPRTVRSHRMQRWVACSSSQQDPASKQDLMQALESAVAREDYAAAAQLKKQIEDLTHQDPILALQKQLQLAVDEERYQVRLPGRQIYASSPPHCYAVVTVSPRTQGPRRQPKSQNQLSRAD